MSSAARSSTWLRVTAPEYGVDGSPVVPTTSAGAAPWARKSPCQSLGGVRTGHAAHAAPLAPSKIGGLDASAGPNVGARSHVSSANSRNSRAAQPDVALAELADEPWLGTPQRWVHEAFVALCRRTGFVPRIARTPHDDFERYLLVAEGEGLDFASTTPYLPEGVVLRPLRDPVESAIVLLHDPAVLDAAAADALVRATRRWYADGVARYRPDLLDALRRLDAHPTQRAALAAARLLDAESPG